MKKKKYSNGESVITDSGLFEFHNPYVSDDEEVKCYVEIDLNDLIDRYAYHDAPSSVDVWWRKQDLIDLRDILNTTIKKIEEMESKSNLIQSE